MTITFMFYRHVQASNIYCMFNLRAHGFHRVTTTLGRVRIVSTCMFTSFDFKELTTTTVTLSRIKTPTYLHVHVHVMYVATAVHGQETAQ